MLKTLIILGLMISQVVNGQSEMLEWTFLHPVNQSWIDLGEKGSVQEALMQIGELPDPFVDENEGKFSWIEEHDWEFKSIFFYDSKEIVSEYAELVFPSIDTYGKVYINDSLVYSADNAFIPHRIQVKKYLVDGANEVTVVITPPIKYHEERYKSESYHFPAPNDVHDIAIAPYTRKPQYQFGWDWSLRLNTIGFNKGVTLEYYNENKIINTSVKVVEVNDSIAKLELTTYFSIDKNAQYLWVSDLFEEENVSIVNGIAKRNVTIKDPSLWWPSGRGQQFIYNDKWMLYSTDKYVVDMLDVKFGVKTSELVMEEDEWGTSYYFKINGERIFCKGANYIPQDIFPARVKDSDIKDMVNVMAESNFNMVRVWGGGYYPDDIFYETCDSLGIMVWQDLMFACAMYPGDNDFIENVSKEFKYQIPRISSHPSVMLFNGNNEVEVAWGNWGFQIKHGLYGQSAKEIEAAYDRLFKSVAPEIVEKTSSIPYIHTSPLSNWGKEDLYNHGSQHYWGVWHGKDPMEDFGKKIGRFNAEYGFQSFPEFNTLSSFSEEKDWDISSDVMKQHQKSYVGNEMILKHAKKLYGKPKDFKEFVYFSQLTQAKAVSMAVAGHRIDAPRCGGTLYWQLNDCWPVSSWSSVDYYGNWKALQYRIKDDYEDIAVLAKYSSLTDICLFIVSSVNDTLDVEVTCTVFSLSGKKVLNETVKMNINGQETHFLPFKNLYKRFDKEKNSHFVISWKDNFGKEHIRTYDYVLKRSMDLEANVVIKLVDIDEENKTAELIIENDRFVMDLWLTSKKFGIKYNTNFNSYLPGTHSVLIHYKELPRLSDFECFWH